MTIHASDEHFLRLAFAEARAARERGENPMGAVIVLDGMIVTQTGGRELELDDPTAHAEVLAIRAACRTLNRFSLDWAILYSNVNPCLMCSGAIKWGAFAAWCSACGKRFCRSTAADA